MAESTNEPIRRRAVSNCSFAPQSVASNGNGNGNGNGTLPTQPAEVMAQRQPNMSVRRLSLVQRNSSAEFNDDFRVAFSNSEHRSLLRTGDVQNGVSCDNAEYERVENWLDEHPDFVADYFVRKANYRHVLSWLDRRAAPTSMDENWTRVSDDAPSTSAKYTVKAYRADESKLSVKIDFAQLRCSLRNSLSGVSTPSRRVSLNSVSERPRRNEERNGAHETSNCTHGASEVCNEPQNEQSAENGRLLCDLLVDLCSANDDAARLCHRVALAVCQLVACESASLFTLVSCSDAPDETRRGPKLVCRALNVGPNASFSESEAASRHPLVLPVGPEGGLIGVVAQSGEPIRVDDAYSDERFNRELDITSGCRSRSVFVAPVKTRDGELIGVVVAANKLATSTVKFTVSLTATDNAAKCASTLPDTIQSGDSDLMIGRRASSGHCRKLSQSEHGQRVSTGQNGRKNSQPELGSHRLCDQYSDARVSPSAIQSALAESGKRKQGQAEAIHPHKYCRSERSNACFIKEDELVLDRFMAVCAMVLRNAAQLEKSQLENRRSEVLLELAGCIFRQQVDLHELIYKIMMYAQSLSRCERCQLLLIDDSTANKTADTKMGMFNQVYDLSTETSESTTPNDSEAARFPISLAVSEYVATTGETINTADLERDHRFSSDNCQAQPDASLLNTTRRPVHSVLCMPIKNGQDQVIGVCLLANKLNERGAVFERDDERFFEAFTLFCGLGIHQTKMYERAIRAVAKQRVALEVLSYHATASIEEAQRLRKMNIPSSRFYQLYDFGFCDFSLSDDDTLKCTLRMFIDLRLVETFRIDYGVLCRFVLSVKKNYRNVTYHNWRHALNVTQSMFAMLAKASDKLTGMLSELEKFGLLVACLCHDLDHRGTNNQFQIKSASALAQLYSTSVMEHHHFDQACMLLQAKGNQLFHHLSREQHDAMLSIIEKAILATDLALYFKFREGFFRLVGRSSPHAPADSACACASTTDWQVETNRNLLRSMLMTACDLSAIYKPWDVQKRVAELVFGEFFEQGDIERSELNLVPDDMMNRQKKDLLPAMQVGYIDAICMPLYDAFALFHDAFAPLRDACLRNRRNWQALAEVRSQREREQQNAAAATATATE